jgi:hypothetical protein
MRALASDRQRKFAYLMACGEKTPVDAARGAGYADPGNGTGRNATIRVTAHHLVHSAKVLDAIEEAARDLLRALGPIAIRRAKEILDDRKHPSHARVIETILDRTGFFARSEHMVKVEHGVDERALEALARRLAAESGIGVEKLLGNTKTIEGEVVQEIDTQP